MDKILNKKDIDINIKKLSNLSRDFLKILLLMVNNYPNKLIFRIDEFEKIVNKKGQQFGGIMKSAIMSNLVIKIGYISLPKFKRAKQTWRLNPILNNNDINKLKKVLNEFELY